jgi:pimeloyl-ACP methyl ester carboxylesterase
MDRCNYARTVLVILELLVATVSSVAGTWHPLVADAHETVTPGAETVEREVRVAIEASIDPDTHRGGLRLPSVRLAAGGDLTVVVALREMNDLEGFRAAAEEDVFQILHAVYTTPESPVETVTVIGTYSVTGTRGSRELRVLRVVLSAAYAQQIDWVLATPKDLFTAADVYRFYPPFGDEEGRPLSPATPSTTPAALPEDAIISSPINIGGRLIFLRCIGAGGPTVILEAGYGDNGTIWAPVQIHASEFVRVCSYDRAGLERSDPPDHYPRTGAEVVADLHATLHAAGVQPPYLLVGHSQGALFSRLFASTYPEEVAGLLLLDPWPEDYDDQLRQLVTDEQWTSYERMLAEDPDNEAVDFPATYEEVRTAPPLPDVPVLTLSHGEAPPTACCPEGWPVAEQEQLWQELQAAMTSLTSSGRQEVVPESGHMIHQAAPEIVVAAIRELAQQIREKQAM